MAQQSDSTASALVERPRRLRAPFLTPSSAAAGGLVTVIDAEKPRTKVELRELWAARELALPWAWRDVKARYKQSLIGVAWSILHPLFTIVVFSSLLGHFA